MTGKIEKHGCHGLLLKTANMSGAEPADPKAANPSSNKEIQSRNPDQQNNVHSGTCPHEASKD